MTKHSTVEVRPQIRAVLVSVNDDGSERRQAVGGDQSVLNIQQDLIRHLSEQPFSDDWLLQLRDYCNARLQARAGARAKGAFVMPQGIEWRAEVQ